MAAGGCGCSPQGRKIGGDGAFRGARLVAGNAPRARVGICGQAVPVIRDGLRPEHPGTADPGLIRLPVDFGPYPGPNVFELVRHLLPDS